MHSGMGYGVMQRGGGLIIVFVSTIDVFGGGAVSSGKRAHPPTVKI